ncbi:DarT ssDNA thymidine ADP-ribosyltransferase family protein [Streptomyces sp. NPDC005407]|uniref:DarT ssDNA thymidine ADP-ribosyltransferase family protein n=1 Tax=Streptomyces sp. NPDC005407 TaxID=3155340 RepID=UPI0033AE89E4
MTATTPPPAVPQGPDQAAGIDALIRERKITEVVHFTTNQGLLGILVERLLQARALLAEDKYLESIYHANAKFRREDPQYWSYVNLSVTQANHRFLHISTDKWWADTDLFWAILSFAPVIMTHPGVLFAPTNMAYQGVTPAPGVEGAEALFAPRVPGGWGRTTHRYGQASNVPTCPQAEVLYPKIISTQYLQCIYVLTEEDAAKAHGIVSASEHDEVDIIVDPVTFGR